MPKYKDITVELIGNDGNAFLIIGRCIKVMRKAKCTNEEIEQFQKEATSGDYNKLLCVCMEYFKVK